MVVPTMYQPITSDLVFATNTSNTWFEAYLTNRSFKATRNCKHSEPGCMYDGVPSVVKNMFFFCFSYEKPFFFRFLLVVFAFYYLSDIFSTIVF